MTCGGIFLVLFKKKSISILYEVLSASKLLCYAATSKLPRAMAVNLTEPVCMKNEIFKESSSQAV